MIEQWELEGAMDEGGTVVVDEVVVVLVSLLVVVSEVVVVVLCTQAVKGRTRGKHCVPRVFFSHVGVM